MALQRQWIDHADPNKKTKVNEYMRKYNTHSLLARKIAVLSRTVETRRCSNCIKTHIECDGRVPCQGCGNAKTIICLYSHRGAQPLCPTGSPDYEALPDPRELFLDKYQVARTKSPKLRVSSPLQSGTADPFSASILPFTAADHALILLWRDWFVHKLWPCDNGVDYLPAVSQWSTLISLAMSRCSCAHALNAAISLPADRRPTPVLAHRRPTGDTKSAVLHAALALSALESDISQSRTDIESVFTIWLLTSVALDFGEYETARIHLKGAKALLKGGCLLSTLPDVLQLGLIEDDMNLSMHSSLRPIFDAVHWDPGDISWLWRPSVLEQMHNNEFLTTPISSCIEPCLRQIFHNYRQLCAIREHAMTVTSSTRRTELVRWADLRLLTYIEHVQQRRCGRFVARATMHNRSDAMDSLEDCIRIALNYLTRIFFHTHHTETDTWNDFADIATVLCRRQVRSLISTRLLLWILAVSAMTEYKAVRATNQPTNSWWHVPRFLALAHSLHITSAEALAPFLRQFLYHKQLNSVLDELFNLGGQFHVNDIVNVRNTADGINHSGHAMSAISWDRSHVINTAALTSRVMPQRHSRYHHDHLYYRTLMII